MSRVDVCDSVRRARSVALLATILVITAVAIFAQVDYAFDRIWNLGVERTETWGQWLARVVLER